MARFPPCQDRGARSQRVDAGCVVGGRENTNHAPQNLEDLELISQGWLQEVADKRVRPTQVYPLIHEWITLLGKITEIS